MLEELKYTRTREDLAHLARRYDVYVAKIRSLARYVNTPTVDPDGIVREVEDDGAETTTMKVRNGRMLIYCILTPALFR